MYESYVWPGACHYKKERNTIIQWVKELFEGVAKRIIEKEKHI